MKYCCSLFTALLLLASSALLACSCRSMPILERVDESDFVGIVKASDIEIDKADPDYHRIQVETVEVYKGEKVNKLTIHSSLSSSCSFMIDKDANWLVYAKRQQRGLVFSFCSGSKRVISKNYGLQDISEERLAYRSYIVRREVETLRFVRDMKVDTRGTASLDLPVDLDRFYRTKIEVAIDGSRSVILKLRYNPDAMLCTIDVVKSSGNKQLDQLAMKTLKFRNRYTNIPSDRHGRNLASTIVFYFASHNDEPSMSIFDH